MTLEDLKLFMAVARQRSVTAAARQVAMSQPNASRRLKALEEEMGRPLLQRDTLPLTLTPTGVLFLEFAESVTRQYHELRRLMDSDRSLIGTVRIASSTSPAVSLVPNLLADFQLEYPGVRFVLSEMSSQAVEAQLAAGDAHVGFMGIKPAHPGLKAVPVAADEILLLAPDKKPYRDLPSPVAWDDVTTFPFIGRKSGSGTWHVALDRIRQAGHPTRLRIVLEVDSAAAVIDAVASGLGVGFVSQSLLEARPTPHTISRSLLGVDLRRPFYLVTQPTRLQHHLAAQSFVGAVRRKSLTDQYDSAPDDE